MEMVLSNNFAMLNETEMLMVDGGDVAAAIALGGLSIVAGVAVIALTPAKMTGVKIIASGVLGAAGLYYV